MIIKNTTTGKTYISQDEFCRRTYKGAHWSGGNAVEDFLGEPDASIAHPASETGFIRVWLWDLDRVTAVERTSAFLARRSWTTPMTERAIFMYRNRAHEELSVNADQMALGAVPPGSRVSAPTPVVTPVPEASSDVRQALTVEQTHEFARPGVYLNTVVSLALFTVTDSTGVRRYGYRWESPSGTVFESGDSDLQMTPTERVHAALRAADQLRREMRTGRTAVREIERDLRALTTLTLPGWEMLVRIGHMGVRVSTKHPSARSLIERGYLTSDLSVTAKGAEALRSEDGEGTFRRLTLKKR